MAKSTGIMEIIYIFVSDYIFMQLQEILSGFDFSEKKKLYDLLKKDMGLIPELDKIMKDLNKDQKVLCPHCLSAEIFGHGTYKGRERYKCKQCKKTFNDYTGTAISGIKKVEKFQDYLELTIESLTIREAAKKLGVNMKAIFDWRHKLLSSIATMNGSSFSGIVECDDKVSIMVTSDRKGNPVMRVAKMGRIDTESIEKTIGGLISDKNVLCSDSHPSIISWASNRESEHHTFVASRQHIKNKCYHVQHVNSMDNLYERWIKPFYGVATKYLPQYLNWFVFLEEVKNSKNPIIDLARTVMSNTSAIKSLREIEDVYLKLDIPHYLKT